MTAFDQALAAFKTTAAAKLGADPASLQVLPGSADVVGFDDQNLPPLVAFAASGPRGQLRGLAGPDGKVVTARGGTFENVSVLLEAGHAYDPAKALPADQLAARLTWLLGSPFSLVTSGADWRASVTPPQQLAPPTLTRDGDKVTLRFFVSEAGDTGVVLGHEVVVTGARGTAEVTMSRVGP